MHIHVQVYISHKQSSEVLSKRTTTQNAYFRANVLLKWGQLSRRHPSPAIVPTMNERFCLDDYKMLEIDAAVLNTYSFVFRGFIT